MFMTKNQFWLTDDGLLQIALWAKEGLNNRQIAEKCGVHRTTLGNWKKTNPNIAGALEAGRSPADAGAPLPFSKGDKEIDDIEVENALRKEALSGRVTAQIFWLKNRRPDKWRDKPDVSMEKALEKLDKVIEKIGK
jgi:hypothetical protein